MFKLLWRLQVLTSRIMGLIRRGRRYFAKSNTTIVLSGDIPRARVTDFWRQIKSLHLSLSADDLKTIWNAFLNFKSLFMKMQCGCQWGKLPGLKSFPVSNVHWRPDNTVYPPCEIVWVKSNSRPTSHMHGNLGQVTIDPESIKLEWDIDGSLTGTILLALLPHRRVFLFEEGNGVYIKNRKTEEKIIQNQQHPKNSAETENRMQKRQKPIQRWHVAHTEQTPLTLIFKVHVFVNVMDKSKAFVSFSILASAGFSLPLSLYI